MNFEQINKALTRALQKFRGEIPVQCLLTSYLQFGHLKLWRFGDQLDQLNRHKMQYLFYISALLCYGRMKVVSLNGSECNLTTMYPIIQRSLSESRAHLTDQSDLLILTSNYIFNSYNLLNYSTMVYNWIVYVQFWTFLAWYTARSGRAKCSKISNLRSLFWAATWLVKQPFQVISFWKYLAVTFLSALLCRATCYLWPFPTKFQWPFETDAMSIKVGH